MKAIKFPAALCLLAAGTVNAASVATYTVKNQGTITGFTVGTITETGTAILDDSGSLTINLVGVTDTAAAGSFTLQSVTVFTGTFDAAAHALTITGGALTNVSCQAGTSACSTFLQLGVTRTLMATPATGDGGGLPLTVTSSGIFYDAVFKGLDETENLATRVWSYSHGVNTTNKMEFTNVAVPLPAAAWLFGSGLLGLFSAVRRRDIQITTAGK
jgi:hypothetical protein